jgi:putative toxin-antitoxin system antitoxin component (TIGR02293 family)
MADRPDRLRPCHMASMVCHMAKPPISDSLNQALRFLDDKGAKKSVRYMAIKAESGAGNVISGKGREPKTTVVRHGKKITKLVRDSPKGYVSLKANVIDRLADKLDVADMVILDVSGISLRTFHRRQQQDEPLSPDEADRVLRIARVAGEAERVFGDAEKSRRWLARVNPLLGAAPLSLLATDAGSRDVEAELMRIDWGDFA